MKIDTRTTSLFLFVLGAVFTIVMSLLIVSPTTLSALGATPSYGFEPLQTTEGMGMAILGIAIGAGLAIGLAGIGAALGMGTASAAALGAITEKPETFGKSILYVVFIEVVAIYGFVIAFLLIGYVPSLIG
ncbi:MAG: ATP synthase subunit C [Promethearchaeota archaeon]